MNKSKRKRARTQAAPASNDVSSTEASDNTSEAVSTDTQVDVQVQADVAGETESVDATSVEADQSSEASETSGNSELEALRARLAASEAEKAEALKRARDAEMAAGEASLAADEAEKAKAEAEAKAQEATRRLQDVSQQLVQPATHEDLTRLGINSGLLGPRPSTLPQTAVTAPAMPASSGPVPQCDGDALGVCRFEVTDRRNIGQPPHQVAWTIPDHLRHKVGAAQYVIQFVGGKAHVPEPVAQWYSELGERIGGQPRYHVNG